MHRVIGVRFKPAGRIYFFDPDGISLKQGDGVIVETVRGVEYGTVLQEECFVGDDQIVSPLKKVMRKATDEDREHIAEQKTREAWAMSVCKEKIAARGLPMKLINVEYTFDDNKIIFNFTAEGRIDFRELVKDLAAVFRTRIELRQIGIRDEAKNLGGLGACGQELCCRRWLVDFNPVSIKMAKTQNLSLNTTKISGTCSRLMCCLQFENDVYEEFKAGCPKEGTRVMTPVGEGKVKEANIFSRKITVELNASKISRDFDLKELAVLQGADMDEEEAARLMAELQAQTDEPKENEDISDWLAQYEIPKEKAGLSGKREIREKEFSAKGDEKPDADKGRTGYSGGYSHGRFNDLDSEEQGTEFGEADEEYYLKQFKNRNKRSSGKNQRTKLQEDGAGDNYGGRHSSYKDHAGHPGSKNKRGKIEKKLVGAAKDTERRDNRAGGTENETEMTANTGNLKTGGKKRQQQSNKVRKTGSSSQRRGEGYGKGKSGYGKGHSGSDDKNDEVRNGKNAAKNSGRRSNKPAEGSEQYYPADNKAGSDIREDVQPAAGERKKKSWFHRNMDE